MKFLRSSNGVILTEGFDGRVPPRYFARVVRRDGTECELHAKITAPLHIAPNHTNRKAQRKPHTSREENLAAPSRLVARYRRRLAEIDLIEQRQAKQEPLDGGQLGKLRRRDAIQAELDALLLHLSIAAETDQQSK